MDADDASKAEMALREVCRETGFDDREKFKWSPGKELWMRDNLVGKARTEFFKSVAEILQSHGASALLVAEDAGRNPAISGLPAERDVVRLLFERITNRLPYGHDGMIVFDTPTGGKKEQGAFLAQALEDVASGTDYVEHANIRFVLASDSRNIRLLQAADLVTSCLSAYVAGSSHAIEVAAALRSLLLTDPVGGRSVKLHPDAVFANLYHWLFGDTDFWRGALGHPMPVPGFPMRTDPIVREGGVSKPGDPDSPERSMANGEIP